MPCCGDVTGAAPEALDPVPVPEVNPLLVNHADVRHEADKLQLEDALEDNFAADYLLKYAESEFSSENVAFILELRKLQSLPIPDKAATALSQQICKTHVEVSACSLFLAPRRPRRSASRAPRFNERARSLACSVRLSHGGQPAAVRRQPPSAVAQGV